VRGPRRRTATRIRRCSARWALGGAVLVMPVVACSHSGPPSPAVGARETEALALPAAPRDAAPADAPATATSSTPTTASPTPTTTSTRPALRPSSATTATQRPASTSTSVRAPTPSSWADLTPPGARLLTDDEAAQHVRRSSWEPRPQNETANQRVPTAAELADFRRYSGQWGDCEHLRKRVTGHFVGTTDEIIQWAAWKWGLPEDVLRATGVNESHWYMSFNGDEGLSFGLYQIKNVPEWHGGTYPLSQESTAFNADYYGGFVRHYYEGCATWIGAYAENGSTYGAGDFWGSVGAWYSGRWHDNEAEAYVDSVRRHLRDASWTRPGF